MPHVPWLDAVNGGFMCILMRCFARESKRKVAPWSIPDMLQALLSVQHPEQQPIVLAALNRFGADMWSMPPGDGEAQAELPG